MKKWSVIGIVVFVFLAGLVFFLNKSKTLMPQTATELDWRQLAEMDYITGVAPKQLAALDGKYVKLPGFMVPLEDEQKRVTEFLLVPNAQACIHVPPPPSNQMVYVKMKKGTAAVFEPIWVYGTLKINVQKSMYGDAAFEIIAEDVELYK
jgi:hypothetical protein